MTFPQFSPVSCFFLFHLEMDRVLKQNGLHFLAQNCTAFCLVYILPRTMQPADEILFQDCNTSSKKLFCLSVNDRGVQSMEAGEVMPHLVELYKENKSKVYN